MLDTPKKTLSQEVYEQMLSNIVNKVWTPGIRLPSEKELMQTFSVSRITIREAIRQMVSLGLLKTIQGSGTYVCEYSPDVFSARLATPMYLRPQTKADIIKVLEVRYLEVVIAGYAAKCSTEESIAELKKIQHNLTAEPYSLEKHVESDIAFHMQICKMTGNAYMVEICQLIYDALRDVMPVVSKIMGTSGACHYHEILIDTIKKHYVCEAKRAMEEHLSNTIQAIMQVPDDSEIFTIP